MSTATSTTSATTDPAPVVFAELAVARVERLSPSFVRVEFTAPELADMGAEGPWYDQRIKLVFASRGTAAPSLPTVRDYASWAAQADEVRGVMRTYSVREHDAERRRLVVDIVVHEDGTAGPGARWAMAAEVGSGVLAMLPRAGVPFGGREFAPHGVDDLLLVGDETAVPALARTLADLAVVEPQARGVVFVEVPDEADVTELVRPDGVVVRWLPRGHGEVGSRLVGEVRAHLGLGPVEGVAGGVADGVAERAANDGEPEDNAEVEVWETPTWSSSGEDLAARVPGASTGRMYAWIAGESRVVTSLRRALVKEAGVSRQQVAFMGYWRRGVAMKG